ncbi:MAG: ABC transporter ATP-binding protein [Planctomycetota bacterium]|nr:ABC transporter ATP-binding protein [Planctomycetota bacterium]
MTTTTSTTAPNPTHNSGQPRPEALPNGLRLDEPLIEIKDLAVSFDNRNGPRIQAVDGVHITIYPQQTVAVVGESGCGKSVSAMSSLQLIPRPPGRFDRGQIRFRSRDGEVDLLTLSDKQMRKIRGSDIAMIFQEPMTSLNPVYTVGDQICEAILLHQNVDPSRAWQIAIDAMRSVGIPEPERRIKGYPHQFSGGMRQRVMIAMALACQPRLLLADEPTTALDVTIQAQILELLGELKRERGMGVMLITHDLGVVAENADVVCVMYAGRVVEYANVLELFNNPMHPYTRGLLASIPKLGQRRERLVTIKEIIEDPEQFKKLPGAETGIRPWWPWNDPPADLKPRPGPAGDYFLQEVAPEHWVGLWRTEAVAAHESRRPDLAYRKAKPS